ncbi:MAG TPA: polyphosphate kinase 1 [Ignavibacteria bacterium]|nr:polyphosphate kinase 1 [Bacteroidota bacterium]HRI85893.1 polyphosphate kinase 1 [Ignavibacteria bacterium]HRJ99276.1 polyphosphate kinase 1 [Ignavibacteria bacterium]
MSKLNSEFFLNRELCWIEFNKRVLEEAKDATQPLLERLKFLSIFSTNLDEFFMIRFAGLKRQIKSHVNELSSDGLNAQEQSDKIFEVLTPLVEEFHSTFNNDIIPLLKENNIEFLNYAGLSDEQKSAADKYFEQELFPILTPLAIDNVHPFPNLINRSLALVILLDDPDTEFVEEKVCVIQIPNNISRFYLIDEENENKFILLEEIIKANADKLFPGMKVLDSYAFRITRNADLELEEEEAADLLTLIEEEVKKRRLGILVRLEIEKKMPEKLLKYLEVILKAEKNEIYKIDGMLNLGDLMQLYKIDKRELKYEGFTPRISSFFRQEEDFFKAISEQDILLHHPFYSFSSVSEFIAQAAEDPNVYAIKLTLYRTSGDSLIIKSLIEAAENGKQVTAVVELKARFDEENNIIWAKELENAGVHVVYGLIGLKTHCKMALVVRKEKNGMKRYLHLSTGNYNSATSRIYTDFGLFTANQDFCKDASNLFNYLTGYSKQKSFSKLLVAPITLRRKVLKLIDDEIKSHKENKNGYILFKNNSVVDEEVILKLYQASKAGVKIDLITRGICRLRPGIEGLSENIKVYSIVGRFLEHSRAYYFHNNGDPKLFFGSADIMQRNFDRRVEIFFPIEDKRVKQDSIEILKLYLTDTAKTWVMLSDGSYIRKEDFLKLNDTPFEKINIQEYLLKKAVIKTEKELKESLKKKISQNGVHKKKDAVK